MSSIRDIGIDTINEQGEAVRVAEGAVDGTAILDGSVENIDLGMPKLRIKQVALSVSAFTDNEDTTGEIELPFTIPAGAVYVRTTIDSVVGFTGDTSAVITIGDGTDVDRYNTGTPNVFATASHIDAGAPSGDLFHTADIEPVITITTATDFTLCKTDGKGEVVITMYWYQSV